MSKPNMPKELLLVPSDMTNDICMARLIRDVFIQSCWERATGAITLPLIPTSLLCTLLVGNRICRMHGWQGQEMIRVTFHS